MLVVKLGGSLITEKSSYCELRESEVRRFGEELCDFLCSGQSSLPVIVLGGGSFGNGIPRKYEFLDTERRQARDLSRMTFGMFELMRQVLDIWRDQGVPAFPIQASAVVRLNGGVRTIDMQLLYSALAQGLIPVITGDILLDGEPVVYSSDCLPGLIARTAPVKRVAMLTDVPGVLDMEKAERTLIRHVSTSDREQVLAIAGGSSQADFTGGMRTKVSALFELLDFGVESLVVDGRRPGMLADVLVGRDVMGTRFSNKQILGNVS